MADGRLRIKFKRSKDYTWDMLIRDLIEYAEEVGGRLGQLDGLGGNPITIPPSGSANDAKLGTFSSFAGTEAEAVAASLPGLGGLSSHPRWWNIITIGIDSRRTQIASEVFGVGTQPCRTFIRRRHDASWNGWTEIGVGTGWMPLPFVNGWTNYSADSSWQHGLYRRVENRVDLSGLVAGGSNGTIAVLPTGFRPTRGMLLFMTMMSPDVVSRLEVRPDGTIFQRSFNNVWQSLSGVSFYVD